MKWLCILLAALSLSACAGLGKDIASAEPATAPAQVGVVNHTGNYIYSASVNGAGGGICQRGGLGGPTFAAPLSPVSGIQA